MLINLEIDDIFDLSQKVKPENKEQFISCVKKYIDNGFLNNENMQIEFSVDYKKIRKILFYIK